MKMSINKDSIDKGRDNEEDIRVTKEIVPWTTKRVNKNMKTSEVGGKRNVILEKEELWKKKFEYREAYVVEEEVDKELFAINVGFTWLVGLVIHL